MSWQKKEKGLFLTVSNVSWMLSSLLWGLEGYLGLLKYLASLKAAAEKIDNTPQLWRLYMNLYAQEDSPKCCVTPPRNSKCGVTIGPPFWDGPVS